MPFVTASTQRGPYDVIIVGSGAGSGQAAYTLCMEGVRVLMLEAGRQYTPATESPMFQPPDMARRRTVARRRSPRLSQGIDGCSQIKPP